MRATGMIVPKAWLNDARTTLEGLRNLSPSWDSYDAPVPEAAAFRQAGAALEILNDLDLRPDRITPSAEGGIAFVFAREERYADLECLNTGEILAVKCDRGGEPEVWTVDTANIGAALGRIREYIGG
jgi:hypothetical protein